MIQNSYIIIGTNIYIDVTVGPLYLYSENLTTKILVTLNNTPYVYNKGELLEQTNNKMAFPLNSLPTYNYSQKITNRIILTFKYSKITLNNESYPLVGFNKVPDITITTTTTNTITSEVKWIDNMAINMFKSIDLIIDDVIIEKIDSDIYTIFGTYILSMFKREDFLNITKITIKKIFFL